MRKNKCYIKTTGFIVICLDTESRAYERVGSTFPLASARTNRSGTEQAKKHKMPNTQFHSTTTTTGKLTTAI